MPSTLEQVLKSFDAQYGAWARKRKDNDDENSFSFQAVSGIDVLRSSESSETLRDLTDRAVPGACWSLDTVHESHQIGLKAFNDCIYSNAAQCFTRALSFLNEDDVQSNSLTAKLYRSRALCLIKLGLHNHAVEDCNLALQHRPDSDIAQFRKAIALKNLGRQDEAIQCARSALEISRSSGRHDGGHFAARLVAELSEKIAPPGEISGVPQPEHTSAPALSLQVRQIAGEGRVLVLPDSTGAETGAVLLAEHSSVVTVCKGQRSQLCHYCLKALPQYAGIPCRACPLAWYCCARHRDLDMHHMPGGPSCGVPWPALLPEHLVLATKLAVLAQERSERDPAKHLETHVLDIPQHQLFEEAVMCCIAARCAQTLPHLVLRAYRQVIINAVAVTPEDHARAEDRLGLAVYPRAAMLNHACAPNVAASFEGSRLLIRAITDLAPGTVLRVCYGPQVGESIREMRRRQLMEQYHFWCRCSACEGSYSAAHEANSVGLKCGACSGSVIPSIGTPAGACSLQQLPDNLEGSGTCFSCGMRMAAEEQAERMARLSEADAAYNRACSLLSHPGVVSAEAINLMESCLKVQEDLLAPNNQVLGRTHDALARAHGQHGDADRARVHAQRALAIVSVNYGDHHHVTQHERSRLEAALGCVLRQ